MESLQHIKLSSFAKYIGENKNSIFPYYFGNYNQMKGVSRNKCGTYIIIKKRKTTGRG